MLVHECLHKKNRCIGIAVKHAKTCPTFHAINAFQSLVPENFPMRSTHPSTLAMKAVAAILVYLCGLQCVLGHTLLQSATAEYGSIAEAISALSTSYPDLSTFVAAVKATDALGSNKADTAWTILAPTNEAFANRLNDDLNMTPGQLLQPENRETLAKVMSNHIIPSGAYLTSDLRDGQQLATALKGAVPLLVDIDARHPDRIEIKGTHDSADIKVRNIVAGNSVIQVIDDVLLPAEMGDRDDRDDRDDQRWWNGRPVDMGTGTAGGGGAGGSAVAASSAAGVIASASGAAPIGDSVSAPVTAAPVTATRAAAVDTTVASNGGASAPAYTAAARSSAVVPVAKVHAAVLAAALLLCMLA